MSRHTRTHHPQPTPPATPMPRKPDAQRHDTAGPPRPAAKISDAKSQANPLELVAPPRRLCSEKQFQLIQMRAYCLWEQAGRPDGDAARENFWFQAEREVAAPPPDGR